ncbi:hypothetical protein FQA39_LY10943 [Lamprigera yunnana]|nr:hypothetical protein FQA39_LY10943 [Lamprigera yunnana]
MFNQHITEITLKVKKARAPGLCHEKCKVRIIEINPTGKKKALDTDVKDMCSANIASGLSQNHFIASLAKGFNREYVDECFGIRKKAADENKIDATLIYNVDETWSVQQCTKEMSKSRG